MALHVSSTSAHHQEVKIALHSLWYHHTYRCDDIGGWWYIYIYILYIYFVLHNLKILLLTIHHYFIYIFVKVSNIQYDQSRILNYTLVLIAAYFTHCS